MTKGKTEPKHTVQEGDVTGIYCVGECGRYMDMTIPRGLILKQIKFVCSECSKETWYSIPAATATKFIGVPPGQTTFEGASDDR